MNLIDKLSIGEASEIFEIKKKETGYKITAYKGNDHIVSIPVVIGKTEVAMVAYCGFDKNTITICCEKLFKKLPVALIVNDLVAYCRDGFDFPEEQIKAINAYVKKQLLKPVLYCVEEKRIDDLSCLLNIWKNPKIDDLMKIQEVKSDSPEIQSILLSFINKQGVQKIEEEKEDRAAKDLGLVEKTLKDWRREFAISLEGDVYSITSIKREALKPTIVIPGYIEGKPVKIGFGGIERNKVIENIILEEGVCAIEYRAFTYCPNLKTVKIPSTVKLIDSNFCETPFIKDLMEKSTNYVSINGNLLVGIEKEKTIVIEEGITRIVSGAFTSNHILEEVVLPDSLTYIGSSAFQFCENLYSVKNLKPSIVIGDEYTFSKTKYKESNNLPTEGASGYDRKTKY